MADFSILDGLGSRNSWVSLAALAPQIQPQYRGLIGKYYNTDLYYFGGSYWAPNPILTIKAPILAPPVHLKRYSGWASGTAT